MYVAMVRRDADAADAGLYTTTRITTTTTAATAAAGITVSVVDVDAELVITTVAEVPVHPAVTVFLQCMSQCNQLVHKNLCLLKFNNATRLSKNNDNK